MTGIEALVSSVRWEDCQEIDGGSGHIYLLGELHWLSVKKHVYLLENQIMWTFSPLSTRYGSELPDTTTQILEETRQGLPYQHKCTVPLHETFSLKAVW